MVDMAELMHGDSDFIRPVQ